jgi:isopenicillin-N N-acyltransferase-like protein
VRKVLKQTDLESAIDVVVEAPLAGGHNFGVLGPNGRGVNIEAMPYGRKVTQVSESPFVHSNHCLYPSMAEEEGDRLLEWIENSIERLQIGIENASDPDRFFGDAEISRSVEGTHDVGTCGAVIIEPAKRVMRAVWGVPGDYPWETFTL